ncbi:radical SAM protein [Patescibacteria group bacterium]|nr:radical SAM protein [Patescibacteria group bacterium]
MKISISFPPIESKKGAPLLTQNRQFQWFNSPTYIYPVIPAYAATLLKQSGFEVFWDDGIAEGLSYQTWLDRIIREKPDIIAIETKTPVIKRHWEIINELKACPVKSGETGISQGAELFNRVNKVENWKPKIVLMGDHATAFPEESMKNSKADFAIAGGDFDFILLSICKGLKKDETGNWKLEAGNLEGGVWRQESGKIKNSGIYDLRKHSLDELPMIDRELTKWKLYGYKNGNFKYTPGAYMMSARDCWWGRCSFCAWTVMFPGKNFRARSAKKALDEVGYLIDLGVKEIMEDSGSLPIGRWLEEFCNGMIERGYDKKVATSCNMRINGIRRPEIWKLMKRAGFRFILFGLESANQITLDKINKNLKVEEIEPGLKMCKEAGLEPHITAMIGYPWETKKMARKTVDLAKSLFKKGYVDTLQATILIPYPGTPLYKYCLENNLLNFTDYDRFDQREQVMKSELTTEDVKELTQRLYKSFITPGFIARKILNIRSAEDVKFLWRAGRKVLGHLADFKK